MEYISQMGLGLGLVFGIKYYEDLTASETVRDGRDNSGDGPSEEH